MKKLRVPLRLNKYTLWTQEVIFKVAHVVNVKLVFMD